MSLPYLSLISTFLVLIISCSDKNLRSEDLSMLSSSVTAISLSDFTSDDWDVIESLVMTRENQMIEDHSNAYSNSVPAAKLGEKIFFDTRFSKNAKVSCGTCHKPDLDFTDGKILSEGLSATSRNAMSILGIGTSKWYFWDGRKDSLWSQALGPFENAKEHGFSRSDVVRTLLADSALRADYIATFGDYNIPLSGELVTGATPVGDAVAINAWDQLSENNKDKINLMYANIGKSIAAYERSFYLQPSRFDSFAVEAKRGLVPLDKLSLAASEVAGLKLFIGKAQCINCHNGPLFSNFEFHNNGVAADVNDSQNDGRAQGITLALNDPFNCMGSYSDADKALDCDDLNFSTKSGKQLIGAFRTSTLRLLNNTALYMHGGQFATLEEVINHYNEAAPAEIGDAKIFPLGLSQEEKSDLLAFLKSMQSTYSRR